MIQGASFKIWASLKVVQICAPYNKKCPSWVWFEDEIVFFKKSLYFNLFEPSNKLKCKDFFEKYDLMF